MSRGRTKKVMVTRLGPDVADTGKSPDEVVTEEPLEIRLDDITVATTMRTPGNDFELAAGFAWGEGLMSGPIRDIRYCGTGSAVESEFNVVSIDSGGTAPEPTPRLGLISSSCGICGSDAIHDLASRLDPVATVTPSPAALTVVGDNVAAGQELFDRTGGLHAAADFDPDSGEVGVVREDIGRHNAVDKVVGRLLLDDELPATRRALWVSGRASFEMVQKAWAAGFGALVSVSAASSLAVETAERAGIAVYGFSRDGAAVRYA
jgi:FdhD protein